MRRRTLARLKIADDDAADRPYFHAGWSRRAVGFTHLKMVAIARFTIAHGPFSWPLVAARREGPSPENGRYRSRHRRNFHGRWSRRAARVPTGKKNDAAAAHALFSQ